jgi:HEAT repeat protein
MSNKNTTNSPRRSLAAPGFAALTIALLVLAPALNDQAAAQQRTPRVAVNRLSAQQGKQDAASSMFQGGRDLITEQQWAKAEEKFQQYTSTYPNEKNMDAALYWLAYSEYQLAKYEQCKGSLTRLLKDYQNSSWKDDAKSLWAQLPMRYVVRAGNAAGVGVGIGQSGDGNPMPPPGRPFTIATPVPAAPIAEAQAQVYRAMIDRDDFERSGDDNDPCEFKIVVLQALFQSDVQRGISVASEWLTPGSTQTVRCKGAALSLLARNGGKAVTPVILNVAQHESDLKLRSRAISALGASSDETVVDPLRDFALNSQENTVIEAAMYALGQHSSPRAITVLGEIAMSTNKPTSLRRQAINSISTRPGEPSVDALLKIYDSDQLLDIRKSVIAGLGHRKSERAGAKLLEIAHNADNIELRKAAISAIATRSGEKSLDTLLSLYDSEKNEELKDRIISAIGGINDTRVTDKLIQIVRDPQAPIERRKRAIGWLSRSKDPKVAKVLEELLK